MEVDFQRPPAEMLYDSYYRTNTRDAVKTALNAKACHCAALAGEQRRLRPLTHPLVKDACADFEVLSHLRDRLAHAHEAERLGFEVGRRIVFGSRISVSLIGSSGFRVGEVRASPGRIKSECDSFRNFGNLWRQL